MEVKESTIDDLIRTLNTFGGKNLRMSTEFEKDNKKYWLHIALMDVTEGRLSAEEE